MSDFGVSDLLVLKMGENITHHATLVSKARKLIRTTAPAAEVSNVIPSLYERYIFPSGQSELWTPRTYTRSRRREKNEFGISRGYISIILIYFEGFHQNVEILKKLLKNLKINITFQKYGISKMHMNTSILLSVVFLPLPTHTNHWTRVHSS